MRMSAIAATTPRRRILGSIPKRVSGHHRGVEAGPRAHRVVVSPAHGSFPRPRIAGRAGIRLSKRIDVHAVRAEVGLVGRVVSGPPEDVADDVEEPGVPPQVQYGGVRRLV